MSKLILHVDGSEVTVRAPATPKQYYAGWAVVAHGSGIDEELSGSFELVRGFTGYHEYAAFVYGVIYAASKGIAFEDVSLFTDDAELGYSNFVMHADNFVPGKRETLIGRLDLFCQKYFSLEVAQQCVRFCELARISKIKGHAQFVYQERCDYLAKKAAWSKAGKPSEVQDFDTWLARGIPTFSFGEDAVRLWHPPFTHSVCALSQALN